jgi:hypothetical protein
MTAATTATTQAPRTTTASNCLWGGNGYNYKTATEWQHVPDEVEQQQNNEMKGPRDVVNVSWATSKFCSLLISFSF